MIKKSKRKPETVASFAARVEWWCRLPVNRIPDAEPDVMEEGEIIASSPHGILVYVAPTGKYYAEGPMVYAKCVLVNRGAELALADPDADGVMSAE